MIEQVCCLAHRELAWLFYEPHTGLDDFLRILLSCFRKGMSGPRPGMMIARSLGKIWRASRGSCRTCDRGAWPGSKPSSSSKLRGWSLCTHILPFTWGNSKGWWWPLKHQKLDETLGFCTRGIQAGPLAACWADFVTNIFLLPHLYTGAPISYYPREGEKRKMDSP